MSARQRPAWFPLGAHQCVVRALHQVVCTIGVMETAKLLCVDDSTITRRIADNTLFPWSAADLLAIKRRERDELGTRTLHDAETAALFEQPTGVAGNVTRDLSREISEDAAAIADANAILADGRVDTKDLPQIASLIAALDRRSANAAELRRDLLALQARLGRGA
jgi:hypothetical protein